MYLSHHWFASRGITPRVAFVHLPLTPEQATRTGQPYLGMSTSVATQALTLLVNRILHTESESRIPFPSVTA